jgi:hypothetical protein
MAQRPPIIEVLDDTMVEVLRSKTPAQRLAIANGMWRYARARLLVQLQKQHPDWDEAAVKDEVRRRLLGSS